MSYKIIYNKKAQKFLSSHKQEAVKFIKTFEELSLKYQWAIQKFDIKSLRGYDDVYRLRIGKYRAIFRVLDDKLVIYVVDIRSRGDVYK